MISNHARPVLIAGAGPTGLSLAHELATHGIPVRIVDSAPPRPDGEGRANGLHSRTLEVLERYGVLARVLDEGIQMTAAELETDDGRLLTRMRAGVPGTPHPFSVILNQSRVERFLVENLAERHAIAIERPVALERFIQHDNGVDAILRHRDGRAEEERFAALAACDGGHSTVRSQLGLDFDGVPLEGAYIMDGVGRWTRPVQPGVLRVVAGPSGCVGALDTPGGRMRVIAILPDGDPRARPEAPSVQLMQSFVDEHRTLGVVIEHSEWASGFRIANRMVERLRHGRVILLGDAAHLHSPFGGQGLNLGVQDAANLGWKLALWWRGQADDRVLDSFDAERVTVIRGVLRRTAATQRILMLSGTIAPAVRNIVLRTVGRLPPVVARARRENEQYGVHYRRSPLVRDTGRRGAVRAGDLMPDAGGLLTAGGAGRRLYAVLTEDPRQTLVVHGQADANAMLTLRMAERARARFGDVIRVVAVLPDGHPATTGDDIIDTQHELHRTLRRAPSFVLIRPDTYIGLRAATLDEVAAHLRDDLGFVDPTARSSVA